MPVRVIAIRKVFYKHHWYKSDAEFEADPGWVAWAARPHLRAPEGLVKVAGKGAAEAPPPPPAPPSGDGKAKAKKAPAGGDR